MNTYKKGQIVEAVVSGIETYGIFVKIDSNNTGLIHISEISSKFVKDINDIVKLNDLITAKIIDIDRENNHINLSIKDISIKTKKVNKPKKLTETKIGFKSLADKLPLWIEKKLKNR